MQACKLRMGAVAHRVSQPCSACFCCGESCTMRSDLLDSLTVSKDQPQVCAEPLMMWGMLDGHCAFSSKPIIAPIPGVLYA